MCVCLLCVYLGFGMGFPYYHSLTLEKTAEPGMHVDLVAKRNEWEKEEKIASCLSSWIPYSSINQK